MYWWPWSLVTQRLFSIVTTPKGREGHYSYPWIAPLTLNPYFIMLSVKQGGIKYHFLSLWYDSTWDWTWFPGPLANTTSYIWCNLHIKKIIIILYWWSFKLAKFGSNKYKNKISIEIRFVHFFFGIILYLIEILNFIYCEAFCNVLGNWSHQTKWATHTQVKCEEKKMSNGWMIKS